MDCHVLPDRLRTMTACAGLLASLAVTAPANAECTGARVGPGQAHLPTAWQAALDELIWSTVELGHPWSCVGGAVHVDFSGRGATLSVAREGEAVVTRQVAAPEDVVPLGQALLAEPLPPAIDARRRFSHRQPTRRRPAHFLRPCSASANTARLHRRYLSSRAQSTPSSMTSTSTTMTSTT